MTSTSSSRTKLLGGFACEWSEGGTLWPIGKDLKRLVLARMKKTGESYTAARGQLLKTKTGTKAGSEMTLIGPIRQ